MLIRTKRQIDYQSLSTWVQRVVLRLGPPKPGASVRRRTATSANEAARCARDLEFSAIRADEATALRDLGASLVALDDARGENARVDAYAAVLSAAHGLSCASTAFVNPPLNAIWADATA